MGGAVAWDIDGTLVDSEPLHLLALNSVCEHFDVDLSEYPDSRFIGVSLPGVWSELEPCFPEEVEYSGWVTHINNHYLKNVHRLEPIAHAREAVHALHALGFRQVAVSNSNRAIVEANLEALSLGDIMQFSISLDDVPVGKPDPAPYRQALGRLSLQAGEVVAVEDSDSGVRSAKAAGLKVIGYSPDGQNLTSADCQVLSLSGLSALIRHM